MITQTIEEYAKEREQNRADTASFKIFTFEGRAYLLPLNSRANYLASGHIHDYRNFQPVPLTATELDMISDGVKKGFMKVVKEDLV